jgi:hypothetical protein
VTPEDVRALVAETTPASVWALSDAVGERKADVATATLDRLLDSTPEPVILAVLHRRIVELLEIGDRLSGGLNLPEAARAMGVNSEFRARTLASQARAWNIRDLTAALEGLVTLDAMVKNVAGYEADTAQRRLAFLLWIRDRVTAGATPVRVRIEERPERSRLTPGPTDAQAVSRRTTRPAPGPRGHFRSQRRIGLRRDRATR